MSLAVDVDHAILRLDDWREKFNGEHVGFGFDEYQREVKLHYPMAYALFIRGYVEMYRKTWDEAWLYKATDALQKLKSLKIDEGCWGLPFTWNNRENEPYLITTAFALHAFLDAYEVTVNPEYLVTVKSGVDWAVNRLGRINGCFKYSPRTDLLVLNAHAEFIGALSRYLHHVKDEALSRVVEDGIQLVMSLKENTGLWTYCPSEPRRYCFHNSYILEGLHYCGKPILETWRLLMEKLMRKDGYVYEGSGVDREARLWSYATNIYVGALASDKQYLPTIVNYVFKNLRSPDGSFYFKSSSHEKFIRHEAHMFYALTKLSPQHRIPSFPPPTDRLEPLQVSGSQ